MQIINRSSDESEITMIFNNKTYLLKKSRFYYYWFVKTDDRFSLITNIDEKIEVSKEYERIILREKKLERICK